MKAVVTKEQSGEAAVEEREKPSPGSGRVLIWVHACGVCRSDLAVLQAAFPFVQFPLVPGYVAAGVVGGRRRRRLAGVGSPRRDVLALLLVRPLQAVHARRGGTVPGGPAGNRRYHQRLLRGVHDRRRLRRPIPDALNSADAAPLMCAGLTVYYGLRNAGFKPGDRVVVIGLGGLGHLSVLYAKAMGTRAAVLSGSPDKEDEAKELGAEWFISKEGTMLSEVILDWEGGANIILATAPSTTPMTDALPGLAPDGTLAVLGATAVEISVTRWT